MAVALRNASSGQQLARVRPSSNHVLRCLKRHGAPIELFSAVARTLYPTRARTCRRASTTQCMVLACWPCPRQTPGPLIACSGNVFDPGSCRSFLPIAAPTAPITDPRCPQECRRSFPRPDIRLSPQRWNITIGTPPERCPVSTLNHRLCEYPLRFAAAMIVRSFAVTAAPAVEGL